MHKKVLKKISCIVMSGVILASSLNMEGQTKKVSAYSVEAMAQMKALITDENGNFLDPEEFDTAEQWSAYYAYYGLENEQIATADVSIYDPTESVSASKAYKVQGLGNRVIQSFYVIGSNIYVTQLDINGDNAGNVYIHRCEISGSTATKKETMVIKSAGHGTTLVPYTYDNPYDGISGATQYFLVCAKAKEYNDSYSTIQIGRVRFEAGEKDATDVERFSNWGYAHSGSSAIGELKSVMANLSNDGNTLYVRVQNTDGLVMNTGYNFATFNDQLDRCCNSSNYVSFIGNTAMKNAITFCFSHEKDANLNDCFQGMDIADNKNIYSVSGNHVTGAPLIIARMNQYGNNKAYRHVNVAYNTENPGSRWEMEGVQITSSNIYIGLCPKNVSDKTVSYIYSISRSEF